MSKEQAAPYIWEEATWQSSSKNQSWKPSITPKWACASKQKTSTYWREQKERMPGWFVLPQERVQVLAPATRQLGDNSARTGASGELMRRDQEENAGKCRCGAAPIRILGSPPTAGKSSETKKVRLVQVKDWPCWAPACAWFYWCVASAGLPIFNVELKESCKATICLSVALVPKADVALMLTCPSCLYPRACVWLWQEHAFRLKGVAACPQSL